MARELPKHVTVEMAPWSLLVAFAIVVFAIIGILHTILSPFMPLP